MCSEAVRQPPRRSIDSLFAAAVSWLSARWIASRRVRMTALGPDADPLATIGKLRRDRGAVFIRRRGEIYVSDPVLAKAVLANDEGLFREHSDFFRIRTGTFALRSAQV